jgi:hypothetical protein
MEKGGKKSSSCAQLWIASLSGRDAMLHRLNRVCLRFGLPGCLLGHTVISLPCFNVVGQKTGMSCVNHLKTQKTCTVEKK